MRILHLHTRYREPGGEDAVVAAERVLLTAAGHEVIGHEVQNPDGGLASAGTLALAPWNPFAARRVAKLISVHQPDVVHAHNTWFALSPSVIRTAAASTPVIMSLHNYRLVCANAQLFRDGRPCELCVGASRWPGIRHRCYRGSAVSSAAAVATVQVHELLGTWERSVSVYLALNEFARQRLVRGGFPSKRIRLAANAVPDPGPRLLPPSASAEVLFVGRLSHEKGVETLLEAWRQRAGGMGLQLTVLGDGPLLAYLQTLRIPGVAFAGRASKEEVWRRMLGARALVVPSTWYEVQPMVVLEAMASGLPVFGSAHGGLGETIAPLGAECLVPPGDSRAWEATLGMLDSHELVDDLGQRARAQYEQKHTPEGALHRLEDAYLAALS